MKLLAICIGRPERLPGKSYRTGINKSASGGAVMIDKMGLVGDSVCNRKHHGGEDQAILLEGSLTLDWWANELGCDLPPGAFGENLIVEGLDNRDVAVGDRFYIGDVLLEATMPRVPCNTLAAKMGDPGFVKRYRFAARPGIYCRVIRPGTISAGDPVLMENYNCRRILVPEIFDASVKMLSEKELAAILDTPIASRLRASLLRHLRQIRTAS